VVEKCVMEKIWLKNVLWKIKKIHSKSFRTKKTLEMELDINQQQSYRYKSTTTIQI
jgi:hypothetical protein